MLIIGSQLNAKQRAEVLSAFVHRWTIENVQRRTPEGRRIQEERTRLMRAGVRPAPLVTDEEWLAAYAFHFVADGSRLMHNRLWCEPVARTLASDLAEDR